MRTKNINPEYNDNLLTSYSYMKKWYAYLTSYLNYKILFLN